MTILTQYNIFLDIALSQIITNTVRSARFILVMVVVLAFKT